METSTRKKRVIWEDDDYEALCKHMIALLWPHGMDAIIRLAECNTPLDIAELAVYETSDRKLMRALRRAIDAVMEPDRVRLIGGISQARWLRSTLVEVLAGHVAQAQQIPNGQPEEDGRQGGAPDVPPQPPDDPPPDRDDEPQDPVPAPVQPSPMEPSYASLMRLARRQARSLKQIRGNLEALYDLVLEVIPQVTQTAQPTHAPPYRPFPNPPKVAIAGLRRHQQRIMEERLKGIVTLEFVDAGRRAPERLSHFDRVYCVQCTPAGWKRRAHHALGGRFEEHHGTLLIIESIERLAGVSV